MVRVARSRTTARTAAIDVVAASWTIGAEEEGTAPFPACLTNEPLMIWVTAVVWPGVRWAGLPKAKPTADAGPAALRSEDALIQYSQIRQYCPGTGHNGTRPGGPAASHCD